MEKTPITQLLAATGDDNIDDEAANDLMLFD